MNRTYICIDLKSFYASVECVLRNLDPLTTNLVVADELRTDKTICLAVSPSLKEFGLPGRARLYEVKSKIQKINIERKRDSRIYKFNKKSYDKNILKDKSVEIDFIVAPPRMKKYMEYSNKIYNIYLKYISSEDILVYSIDEVFCDITAYLKLYNKTALEIVSMIVSDIYKETGITATAGIGDNMFLAKVAMDVIAKHKKPNEIGVRCAYLNELTYRKLLWNHKPITDIWRVGKGYKEKLEKNGMYTMGDVALCSIKNEELLYKLFGVNAEFLIDHAWGWEPCTIKDIKKYKPKSSSVTEGQVLHSKTSYEKTLLIVKEMSDALALNLSSKNMVTNKIILTVGYDIDNLNDFNYTGKIEVDRYGRYVPKSAHGTITLPFKTSSSKIIIEYTEKLFNKIIDKNLYSRRINICATVDDDTHDNLQLDLFSNNEDMSINQIKELNNSKKDEILQKTVVNIKKKYGKNAVIKGMDLEDGATAMIRNSIIGGHHE